MLRKYRGSIGALAAMLALGSALISAPASAENDNAAVLAANAAFYAALNKLFAGEIEPIKAVWSNADDVTYMGPDGSFEHGWPSVLKDWESQAALKLGGKVEPVEVQMIVGQDIAIVNDYEQGENTNAKGRVEHVRLRATNLYRKENGQWKMVGHHTDLLPFLAGKARKKH